MPSIFIMKCCNLVKLQMARLDSVNVTVGEKEERMMMTGLHTVVDIFCVCCGSIVGWKYVRPLIPRLNVLFLRLLTMSKLHDKN